MMLTISVQKPGLVRFSHDRTKHLQKFDRIDSVWSMKMESKFSHNRKMEELSVELPTPSGPHFDLSRDRALQFNRGQPPDKDLDPDEMLEFGGFIAREAMCDEEFWTAAWLRAETRWEDRNVDRYVDNHKRKFTEQEFNKIKRQSRAQFGEKCRCIVTMKKDSKCVKRTVLKSMVGTLDLHIRYLFDGETFPGERVKRPIFNNIKKTTSNSYGYIANLCVTKSARRQGVARNMLQFAVKSARLQDVEQVYVHVERKNKNAQELYEKMGFQIIEGASPPLEEEQLYLLCLKI